VDCIGEGPLVLTEFLVCIVNMSWHRDPFMLLLPAFVGSARFSGHSAVWHIGIALHICLDTSLVLVQANAIFALAGRVLGAIQVNGHKSHHPMFPATVVSLLHLTMQVGYET